MLVLADGPDEMTAPRFWEMIWDYNCAYIIMLTPLDADEVKGAGHVDLRGVKLFQCGPSNGIPSKCRHFWDPVLIREVSCIQRSITLEQNEASRCLDFRVSTLTGFTVFRSEPMFSQ